MASIRRNTIPNHPPSRLDVHPPWTIHHLEPGRAHNKNCRRYTVPLDLFCCSCPHLNLHLTSAIQHRQSPSRPLGLLCLASAFAGSSMQLDAATPLRIAVRHHLALPLPPSPTTPTHLFIHVPLAKTHATTALHGPTTSQSWNLEQPCPFAAAGGTLPFSTVPQPTLRVSNHVRRHRQFHLLVSCRCPCPSLRCHLRPIPPTLAPALDRRCPSNTPQTETPVPAYECLPLLYNPAQLATDPGN
ncbi:uncharacterized protein BDZ83DRAFT_768266 [Colletotrichum acutatum]|uniref:Uncharacterized protein n=1 Tax=Glomerella acutata TaxID=27357 RepID=A0AAD8XQ29_GLOAC|nr:uncharacterized protein BDZ83DRAFT_768266 [Colletotrichum acutatum]KAK1731449.1 hypothetical protein BDZ83DRAFT_768266 [Colletotrichum acutatum]